MGGKRALTHKHRRDSISLGRSLAIWKIDFFAWTEVRVGGEGKGS